ncbi:rhomboid family intramembrane serine protease [Salibacterium salarium]|uniref:Rhomboid family intramembrane serine protease n=1 Tax=Salibacterium salarium TaxID=284579 RepID=A0A428MXT2_9BACI|nr:rhomboid family intramembrane serine protease [Salibacterium salarium]RSL30932.1 rhomboid family intramembrane serine protease [Salibacterium salarium]
MEPSHLYWKFIYQLVIKENARVLDISPDKKQVWLEIENQAGKAAVRVAKIEHDWMQQLDNDAENAKQMFNKVKKMILGRNIGFFNVYVSSYPPVDLNSPLTEHWNKEERMRSYFMSKDPSGQIADRPDQVLKHIGTATVWDPIKDAPENEHEAYARYYRKEVQTRQKYLEKQDRSLLLFSKQRFIYVLLAAIFLVFFWIEQSGGSTNILTLIDFGAKYNPAILDGEWWRLFSSMFLHIGFFHLLMNSLALFYLGGAVERMYGTFRFIFIYFIAGLFGSLASFAFNAQVSAGASGAIFGCFGALLYFGMIHKKLFFRTMGMNVLVILAINLAFGFAVPAVDNGAHIGGLVGGFLASATLHLPKHRLKGSQLLFLFLIPAVSGGLWWYGLVNDDKMEAASMNVQIAQEYLQEDNIEQARTILMDTIETNDNALAYFVLGNSYLQENNYEQAIENYKEAATLDSELAQAYYNLSIAYIEVEQYKEAESALQQAKELNANQQHEDMDIENIESLLEEQRN